MVSQGITHWLQRALFVCVVLFIGTVAILFLLGLTLPDHFEVQRTAQIQTSRARLHPLITDLKRWSEWTDWGEDGGDLIHEYSDPSTGVGAWHRWQGAASRAGIIVLTTADVERGVWYDIRFAHDPAPMKGALRYLPSESGVLLEWSVRGDLDGAMERALGPVFAWRMGADFDASLASLTKAAERSD